MFTKHAASNATGIVHGAHYSAERWIVSRRHVAGETGYRILLAWIIPTFRALQALPGSATDEHARSMLPLLRSLRAAGTITIGAVTRALNDRKIRVPCGERWHVSSVANPLARAQKLEEVR